MPYTYVASLYIKIGVCLSVCLSGHLNRFGQMNLCQNNKESFGPTLQLLDWTNKVGMVGVIYITAQIY